MGYAEQRDAILAHAVTAAATVDAQWKDVAVGAPIPRGNRCVRLFWTGEAAPEKLPGRVLNGSLIAPTCGLVAFWSMSTMDEAAVKAIDNEMASFVHYLRTAILADSQLGGQATDLEMGFAEPDFVVIGGGRWATVEVGFTLDYIEYPLGA